MPEEPGRQPGPEQAGFDPLSRDVSSSDRQNPIRIADEALQGALSAQRFKAVVERVRKQVKNARAEKGEKKSKWVDTDKFTFTLFPGARLVLPRAQAVDLTFELNKVVTQLLADWREVPRKHISAIAAQSISLASAKLMQECLHTIERIDALGYTAMQVGNTDADWMVHSREGEGVALVGDDKAMTTLFNDANRSLATLTLEHREVVTERLRAAVAAIP